MSQDPDAKPPGTLWSAGNDPNDPPQLQWLASTDDSLMVFYYTPRQGGRRRTLMLAYGPVSVDFSLTCEAFEWFPITFEGKPGKPYLVFSCDTTNTRLIPPDPTRSVRVLAIDGAPTDNRDYKFDGYEPFCNPPYIEEVRITMAFVDATVKAELKKRIPEGDHASGEISSSESHSLGLGFFGSDLTFSLDYSWSKSNSMSLRDYRISSQSDGSTARHRISLAMLDGGAAYGAGVKPGDLPWVSTRLQKVPPMALEDMELNVSGLWQLPVLAQDVDFAVTVEADIVLVGTPGQAFDAYPKGTGEDVLDFRDVTQFSKRTAVFRRLVRVPASRLGVRSGLDA